MTRTVDPGFDPRIADWLENDPGRAPAQVMEVVGAALPSLPQRRIWRPSWRTVSVSRIGWAAAGLAAAVIVIAVVALMRPGVTAPVGGGTATPNPSTTQSPSSTPSPTPTATLGSFLSPANIGRVLAPGTYQVSGFAVPFDVSFANSWTLEEFTDNNIQFRRASTIPGRTSSHILLITEMSKVYPDPCHADAGPTPVDPGADALLEATMPWREDTYFHLFWRRHSVISLHTTAVTRC